jgi:Peptidase family M49
MRRGILSWAAVLALSTGACGRGDAEAGAVEETAGRPNIAQKLAQYTPVRLTADLSGLSERERRMIPLLIEAAQEMDTIFWQQVYPARDSLLGMVRDSATRQYILLNYGPWDRLDENAPFFPHVGPRPDGAAFYPADMSKEEFEAAAKAAPDGGAALRGLYTVVRRDSAGRLVAVPYHQAFADASRRAAAKLREAAGLADDPGLKKYLELRAGALETDDYRPSDLAWLDMKRNAVDIVIGPIETYDDGLFGYKAANEAYVLVKDRAWSERLARYAKLLPGLQRGLPVPEAYKREKPGTDSDLNAYDAVYYTGQANAGSKTIAINLPNDEQVQLKKGTRRLQLKNAMRAKFDKILVPIGKELIADDQQQHIVFDAFFANVMFHEVAHGLGVKNTINGKGTVRDALKEQAGALEEGKADILGLYMITRLQQQGDMPDADLDDNYVTFLAGILRSIRFGAASAHGRANAAELSFLQERGGFARDSATGRYRVDFTRMRSAVDSMAGAILRLQGDGDYEGVKRFMAERGKIPGPVQSDLDRLGGKGIPVDIVFEQGVDALGLGRQ